jgi:hypothetical protein
MSGNLAIDVEKYREDTVGSNLKFWWASCPERLRQGALGVGSVSADIACLLRVCTSLLCRPKIIANPLLSTFSHASSVQSDPRVLAHAQDQSSTKLKPLQSSGYKKW